MRGLSARHPGQPGRRGERRRGAGRHPAIREITERFIGDPELSNLPRKFKTSVSWLPDVPFQIHDVSFLGVEHPELGPGFDLWLGGGLSTAPRLADRAGAWVPLAEVPEVWAGWSVCSVTTATGGCATGPG
ncbi:hypothetical protein SHKM778_25600 [Streptomyces sp. KM77-8]|uniref:Nitrite/sulphite reductase 4Fe-4S domain-containing protein n=1 Tax=Streptomyces haneummycinicus TaxID=3074435 RepID=A0AAT9HFI9_9ACTN